MANFCRDLCDGLIGNCRNCMTTPITRQKIYWFGGGSLFVIILIIIICVSVPNSQSSVSGRDSLTGGITHGVYFLPSGVSETTDVSKFDRNELKSILNNTLIRIQMFGATTPCDSQYKDAVALAVDQLDYISRLAATVSPLSLVSTSDDYSKAYDLGRIAVLPTLAGGQALDGRLALVRSLYKLGVRVVTLVSTGCSTPWAKAVNGTNGTAEGLTDFGKAVVKEMNRLGMMIDIAGADPSTQAAVLDVTESPVLAIGIGLKSIVDNPLNMDSNGIVKKFVEKKGLLLLSTDCQLIAANPANCTDADFTSQLKQARDFKISVGLGGVLNASAATPSGVKPDKLQEYFDSLYNGGFDLNFLKGLAKENFLNTWKAVEKKGRELSSLASVDVFYDRSKGPETSCYSLPPSPTSAPVTTPSPTDPPTTSSPKSTTPQTKQ